MDQKTLAPRSLLRFGIRDLLWSMLVAGLVIGWWIDASTPTEVEQIIRAVSQRTDSKILIIHWNDDGTVEVTTGWSEGPSRGGGVGYTLQKEQGVWVITEETWWDA